MTRLTRSSRVRRGAKQSHGETIEPASYSIPDFSVTFYDANKAEVFCTEIRKGQREEVEILKGAYKAEALQAGKREHSSTENEIMRVIYQ